ncbi:hypothetical protein CDCA_CDCA01G0157 [Cyanidium caldarium]|uniref:Ubiquinol oxidase n=1 Tax=Cyanidium caldarium TaxID=2771 RepID=A0AAV9IP53_CYACA|nr:hypothetical protein CDCA_CDCA01G0157 [Cyanidium caldarium]
MQARGADDTGDVSSGNEKRGKSLLPPLPYVAVFERLRTERMGNALVLGVRNFVRESRGIALDAWDRLRGVNEAERLPGALQLKLDDEGVRRREQQRDAETGYLTRAPWLSRVPYQLACAFLDLAFTHRPISRFWFLETVARMPYFSYLSVLHLYETFNWLHLAELRKIHFEEEWNEMHHLLIMSALGGDERWLDRFLAYHLSVIYYWLLVALYIVAPAMSYNFSELLEKHAVDTYSQFLEENAERLRNLPAPEIAMRYYATDNLFQFGEHAVLGGEGKMRTRPPVASLYDVFVNIRDDEDEHVRTMVACQDYDKVARLSSSPHLRQVAKESAEIGDGSGHLPGEASRSAWKAWADRVNAPSSTSSSSRQTADREADGQ